MPLAAPSPPRENPLADPASFAVVFTEHAPAMTDAAHAVLRNRAQAQDVVQDVFLHLWRRPHAYDPARGQLGSYLRLLARSRALDAWRQASTAQRAGDRLEATADRHEPSADGRPAEALERSEDRAAVRRALNELPGPQREALVLTYWGGLTAEQIACRAAVPVGTAKSRLRLGLQRLRLQYEPTAA